MRNKMKTAEEIYTEICSDTEGPVRWKKFDDGGLHMANHFHPVSLKVAEFDFIVNYCQAAKLTRGYEIATAFGISSLAFGIGIKSRGGKMVTMDAYVEEVFNDAHAYENVKNLINQDSDGLKSTQYLLDKYELAETVFPTIGWSPNDTVANIKKHIDLDNEKLDFIFVDGGHWGDQVIQDVKAVEPFIANNATLFFHDCQCLNEATNEYLTKTFGSVPSIVVPWGPGYNLGIIKI